MAMAGLSAVGASALWLDRHFPTPALESLTLTQATALLGQPTNSYEGPFNQSWSREAGLASLPLAEKTVIGVGLLGPQDRVEETLTAWRFTGGIHLDHVYEPGHTRGLFCFSDPFRCRLE